jgi:hypothetical protein
MPAINLTTTSTFSDVLSAFGPNKNAIYTNLILKTTQSPVTAFVESISFAGPRVDHEAYSLFTFSPSGATTGTQVTNTGRNLGLSAHVEDGARGAYTGSLNVTLSSTALSGVAETPITVTNPSQAITFSLTATNTAYHGKYDRREWGRKRNLGYY